MVGSVRLRKFDAKYGLPHFLRLISFRLYQTAFHAGTHEEAEVYQCQNQPETLAERLRVAMYLNSVAFNFDIISPPHMDRTVFSCRAHAEQSADNG